MPRKPRPRNPQSARKGGGRRPRPAVYSIPGFSVHGVVTKRTRALVFHFSGPFEYGVVGYGVEPGINFALQYETVSELIDAMAKWRFDASRAPKGGRK